MPREPLPPPPALPPPAALWTLTPTGPALDAEPAAAGVPFSHYLWILRRQAWKIGAFVTLMVVGALVVTARLTPVYEATATVDIDRQAPSGLVGQDAQRVVPANDADQFLATQAKLIQSDSVLRPVALKHHLLEHERQLEDLGGIAPEVAKGGPVVLKNLKVRRPPSTYLLQISYRSPDAKLAAAVANDIAGSYLEHTYHLRIRSSVSLSTLMEAQLDELRAKMERSSLAVAAFERELNVINPEEKTSLLSARLLQLNSEYTQSQADRVRKQAAHEASSTGALEAAQVSAHGESLRRLAERLNEAEEKFAEVKSFFAAQHPEYQKTAAKLEELQHQFENAQQNVVERVAMEYQQSLNRERMLARAVGETKTEFDKLNGRSFEYRRFKNEAEADKRLYEELVRKIREAGINAGFQNSAIRLADEARPGVKPVLPNVGLNVLLAFLFSTVLAVGLAVLSDSLDQTIRDSEQIAGRLNTEVIGFLPLVKDRRSFSHLLAAGGAASPGDQRAESASPGSRKEAGPTGFEEAVRMLRNSVLLADFDGQLRSILLTSSGPGEGKSTVALHLAISHAKQQKKSLIIDADLRRPALHKNIRIDSSRGLSDVLTGDATIEEVTIASEAIPNLYMIPAGPSTPRAADLVGERMSEVLARVTKNYDLVIVDGPPLLGFAETLQIASLVDGIILLALAGQTNRKAVAAALSVLKRLRANVLGLVLNKVDDVNLSSGYHYYGYPTGNSKYYQAVNGGSAG